MTNGEDKAPYEMTLWMHCFFELWDQVKKEGRGILYLADVDKLVIEKSKAITKWEQGETCKNKIGLSQKI